MMERIQKGDIVKLINTRLIVDFRKCPYLKLNGLYTVNKTEITSRGNLFVGLSVPKIYSTHKIWYVRKSCVKLVQRANQLMLFEL